ncbi:acetyl-CoA carboxylase biotin carboxylase subunit family protein [Vibrio splendidus]
MKKIALLYPLNAESKKRYVQAIEKLGYEPIIVVGNNNAFLEEKNRVVLNGDTENASRVAQVLRGVGDVCAVIAAGEFSVEMAEKVSDILLLKKSMKKPASILRNKAIMRTEFTRYGVEQPKVLGIAKDKIQLSQLADKVCNFPIISKPVDMAGSWFVAINHNRQSIIENGQPIFDYKSAKTTGLNFECQCLLESFFEGEEYSAEVIVHDGHIVKYIVNKKILSALPYFDEVGHICGVSLGMNVESTLLKNLHGIIAASGVTDSVIHVEFRVNNMGELNIIEAGCRVAGDRISELVQLKYDISLEEVMVRLKAGLKLPSFEQENDTIIGIRFLFLGTPKLIDKAVCIVQDKMKEFDRRENLQATHIANRLGYEIFTLSKESDLLRVFS